MKATEMLEKIQSLLNIQLSEDVQEDVKVEFAVEELSNGTKIEAEAFAEGEAVFIVTEEDETERVPLPAGNYEMADGRELVVEIDGEIKSIGEPSEAEGAEEGEEATEEVEQAEEPKDGDYATKAELSAAIDEIKQMIEDKLNVNASSEQNEDSTDEVNEVEVEAAEQVKAEEVELSEVEGQPVTHNPEGEPSRFEFAYVTKGDATRKRNITNILNNLK